MDSNLGQVVLVRDINLNFFDGYYDDYPVGSYPGDFTEFNGQLYFSANDGENGDEVFVSDGTAEGTQLLVDLNPGSSYFGYSDSSAPSDFTEFNGLLYFSANDGESGTELFVSDGTAEGTQLLVDLNPDSSALGYSYGSNPSDFTEFNGLLYFSANDGENGTELFVSDGTAEGTQLLADLNPGSSDYGYNYGSFPSDFTEFNDLLYFAADDGENGRELFVSDGTAEGTQLLVDLNPGSSSYYGYFSYYSYPASSAPSDFVEFNGLLYFAATDGENGRELFVSDGTAEGTQLLVDLNPGSSSYYGYYGYYSSPASSNPSDFVEFNGLLYFAADDGENGRELFVSDGTAEGTQLLVDLNPGSGSSPSDLVEFNDKLYFAANDGENGRELFVTDGTAEGTELVADINPGSSYGYSYGSFPTNLTVVGDQLFFSANTEETGTELFTLIIDDSVDDTPIAIDGSNGPDNLVGSDSAEDIQALSGQDTVDSGGGDDTIDGGNGDDLLISLAGNNNLIGANGNDTLDSGDGDDLLDGGNGNDSLTSLGGDDNLIGGAGNDTLNSGSGDDTLSGGNGSDVLNAGSGNDSLTGGQNNDFLDGGSGDDTLSGDNGNDDLLGGSGDDILTGGSSNDFLDGGLGNDTLDGGNGDDIFVLRIGDGSDTILDFNLGSDRLGLGNGLQFDSLSFTGNDILSGGEVLASLDGIDTEQLTSSDFSVV